MDTSRPLPPDSTSPIEPAGELMSIAAVERETGLGKDTLRAWERRYGFPIPERDAAGVRGYPRALVERLCLIRRALLAGQRPGRLLALPPAELDALLAALAETPVGQEPAAVARSLASSVGQARPRDPLALADCMAALRAGGAEALRHWLTRGLARMGLAAFVVDGLAPLTTAIGAAWLDGGIAIYEEHLYSEAVQTVLRNALLPFQVGLDTSAPRTLLTTVPGEEHGLGLLMVEALLTLESCCCLSLGVQTPLTDIVAACGAHRIDVVALSFSARLPEADAQAALAELRRRLPAATAIWAGGSASFLRKPQASGIQVLPRLVDIGLAVAAWRRNSDATGGAPKFSR